MKLALLAIAAAITANVINGPDAELEPSVLNEVEHAISRAKPAEKPHPVAGDVFGTNGLSRTAIALKLVSSQTADGTWLVNGTNFTAEAVRILSHMGGIDSAADFSIILRDSEKKDQR